MSKDVFPYKVKFKMNNIGTEANVQSSSSATSVAVNSTLCSSENLLVYTEEEKRVLEHTSHINSKTFVPFMSIDLKEQFVFPVPFTDTDGLLDLAPKQKEHFVKWQRISQICKKPKIIFGEDVDCYSIKQSVVGDCSFVASLAVAASYEKRFRKRLISSIIYPRNIDDVPVYNPSGKYMVKLHMNGVPRKIVIDDYLPTGPCNQLLCSHSSNPAEFWISLLEKAFLKLMGGYNFPGSVGSQDLHVLTGWIPEISLIEAKDPNFKPADLFERMKSGLSKGCCLITVIITGISDEEAERAGLVGKHAYAVLDLREIDGVKMLQLKNPWSRRRWKGNYSEYDIVHWTKKLQQLLGYEPKKAEKVDDGVFWIDYNSLLFYFDVLCMNWDPALFGFTYAIHGKWSPGDGFVANTVGDNPQYSLSVAPGAGSVWVLLTSHITSIEDLPGGKEFIYMLVYLNNGGKVLFPFDHFTGDKRINNRHYLLKVIIHPTQTKKFTLIVSQFNKRVSNYYTIRVYSSVPFELKPLPEHFHAVKKLSNRMRNFLHI